MFLQKMNVGRHEAKRWRVARIPGILTVAMSTDKLKKRCGTILKNTNSSRTAREFNYNERDRTSRSWNQQEGIPSVEIRAPADPRPAHCLIQKPRFPLSDWETSMHVWPVWARHNTSLAENPSMEISSNIKNHQIRFVTSLHQESISRKYISYTREQSSIRSHGWVFGCFLALCSVSRRGRCSYDHGERKAFQLSLEQRYVRDRDSSVVFPLSLTRGNRMG